MTLKLTLAEVKTQGLKAYNEKRLSAQGPTPRCNYRDPSGRPCIVGAAIPDDIASKLPQTAAAWSLRGEGVEIACGITHLQKLHDAWATSFSDPQLAATILREPQIQEPAYYEAKLVEALQP